MREASIIAFTLQDGVAIGRITCPNVGEREGGVIVAEAAGIYSAVQGRVALDLSRVTMIASAGLGALITISKDSKANGGGLALFNLNKDLEQLIKITRLDRLFAIKPDQTAAIKALK
ncbi:MAG: STAS domain-containing protein [Phycisphaerales bacterium]